MFIGVYELDNKIYNAIYEDSMIGWNEWYADTFSPNTKNISILALKTRGKNYKERKANAIELAKEWQNYFAQYSWSYGELAEIGNWFYENGKRYGLLREFRENGIC